MSHGRLNNDTSGRTVLPVNKRPLFSFFDRVKLGGSRPLSQTPARWVDRSGSGAMVFVCGHCEKRFQSQGKLALHERVHAKDAGPFYCSFCPKTFSCQSKSTVHERIHTGEKPYACSMCPRRFSEKRSITRHEQTHTGEKPYGCSMCHKKFARRSHVTKHERAPHYGLNQARQLPRQRYGDSSSTAS